MADRNASDSRNLISPSPPPISMDSQGSDSTIPLSPQWLLPKMGESKHESGNEDEHFGSALKNDKHLDILKSSKSGEIVDPPKRKDVFRPSLLDQETGRHDFWRDEERDTNPSVRRDRWREGDREPSDNHKIDRWADKSASKHYGENQRSSSDRWADSGSKDSGYERRESKWTNRWGPNDKDKEVSQEKLREFGRVNDIIHDKGLPAQSTHRKDEKDGDVRPWRLNSSSQSRGRGESPHSQTLTPSKSSAFSYGRGRSENQPPPLVHTHRRPNMSNPQSSGLFSDREENIHIESSFSRYSRVKLLDVYRTMDKRRSWNLLDGFVEVPSLTQDELTDPLGLSAPSPEESIILMEIDKGDVLSSGVPVNNKEKSAERHPSEFPQSRRPKIGSREDIPHMIDGSVNDNADEWDQREKQARHYSGNHTDQNAMSTPEDTTPFRKSGELSTTKDAGVKRDTYVPPGSSWRSPSAVEHAHLPRLQRDMSDDIKSNNPDIIRAPHMKNLSDDQDNGSTYHKNEPKWQVGSRHATDTPSFASVQHGNESRKLPSLSPEDMVLFYKDPQGNIQGPFTGSDIIGWYDAGYFGIDLQVRLASASDEQPFSVLGDVMPHLRSKARPPPGFNAPKLSDPLDVTSKFTHSNSGKLLGNASEMDTLKNDLKPMHGFSTDADSRFLESLMAGPHGYFGNNPGSVSPIGVDNANIYLLAKKIALEQQQRSWPRDPTPMIPKPDMGPESASVHSNLHPPLAQPSQNNELLAMLQGVSERSTPGINNAANSWSNFPNQGGSLRENMDLYQGQHIHQSSPIGIQHQILQAQNNPSLLNFLSQSSQSVASTPESVPAFPQDPQTLSMLQQQYLINLHSQAPPLPQLSVLDKLLLLQQQQQKQSEQQQLLRQQNMFSQAFSEMLPHQHPGGPSYGQMQANAAQGGVIDKLQPHTAQLQFNSGMPRHPNIQDENISGLHKAHPQILQGASILSSQTPQVISELSNQIPLQVIQSEPIVSQDALKLDPRVLVEGSKSSVAHSFLQPSKDATCNEANSREHLPESHRRTASIHDGVGDGYKSLDNNHPQSLKPSNVTADITFTLPSVSRKHPSTPKSVEPHDSSEVSSSSIENHIDDSKVRVIGSDQNSVEPTLEKEMRIIETNEGKKCSEKKSRKQKASKVSEQARGVLKTKVAPNTLCETDGTNVNLSKGDLLASGDNRSDDRAQQTLSGYANILKDGNASERLNVELKSFEGFPFQNAHPQPAWKPAPGFKPKSLLEIQQEELKRSQAVAQTPAVALSSNSSSLTSPLAEVVSNADSKTSKGYTDVGSIELVSERASKPHSNKSELHDLLADKVITKLNDVEMQRDNQTHMLPELLEHNSSEPTDDLDFIQAKDTKKSRKKSGKTKGGSSKIISVTHDASLGSSSIEKIKSSRQVHQETEVLPSVPSGPSLGDFVVWKGESASVSSSYAPAWSNDSGKVQPVLLRDILKEQEKKTPSHQSHQKPLSTQPAHGIIPSSAPVAPPLSKAKIPAPVNSASTHSKHSGDDDLFWGPIDSSKQDTKHSDFPRLASHSSSVTKNSTPLKGNIGGLTKQKSVSSKTTDYSQSYSPQTSLKGRKDSRSKKSEAMDFRDWCEAESARLIGSKDTSFLEFCLKQTRSEAEILLVENLGSYDPKHEFIDKFLNYKELLPADVLEIAFQSQNDQKISSGQASFTTAVVVEPTQEQSTIKSGGKKKSKKGKKVSPSVLGFNVVSNRIMMGEIQTVED